MHASIVQWDRSVGKCRIDIGAVLDEHANELQMSMLKCVMQRSHISGVGCVHVRAHCDELVEDVDRQLASVGMKKQAKSIGFEWLVRRVKLHLCQQMLDCVERVNFCTE